jgi:hypothetical protein
MKRHHWRDPEREIYFCGVRGCALDRARENLLGMSARVIQVRPSRNELWQKQRGWEVFEAEGVCPVYCDAQARESALSYARQRAGYGRTEIQVLDEQWNIADIIDRTDSNPLV